MWRDCCFTDSVCCLSYYQTAAQFPERKIAYICSLYMSCEYICNYTGDLQYGESLTLKASRDKSAETFLIGVGLKGSGKFVAETQPDGLISLSPA